MASPEIRRTIVPALLHKSKLAQTCLPVEQCNTAAGKIIVDLDEIEPGGLRRRRTNQRPSSPELWGFPTAIVGISDRYEHIPA